MQSRLLPGFTDLWKLTTPRRSDLCACGLRNAYATEVQARELMERESERLGDYPQV